MAKNKDIGTTGATGQAEEMDKIGSYRGEAGDGGDKKFPFQRQVGLMASDSAPLSSNDRQGMNTERKDRLLP